MEEKSVRTTRGRPALLPTTAPDRLAHVLPWLNGDALPHGEVVAALWEFLMGYSAHWSGDAEGERLRISMREQLTPRRVARLRRDLLGVLGDSGAAMALKLKLSVVRRRPRPHKLPAAAVERRAVNGPGAYRLDVEGSARELVAYCFLQTLTEPGAVTLSRCPAPAARDWSSECGRWVVGGQRRGRPPEYCSGACRDRAWRKRESQANRR